MGRVTQYLCLQVLAGIIEVEQVFGTTNRWIHKIGPGIYIDGATIYQLNALNKFRYLEE